MKLQIIITRDEDGLYVASCPAIKGCHSQGDTYEEALKNIQEAIELNLEHLAETNKLELESLKSYPRVIATEDLTVTL
ncbi:MAG: type II toxin-antitoxin system HicB family antitoxin [Deltaproteobacteria bacterium]|nr:type II toxin-antitoxin system HicB family antitoxin [Deltaproteobacteria bacterium]